MFYIGKPVAIKILSLDPANAGEVKEIGKSIVTEIKMSRRLSRAPKHIVPIYDFNFHQSSGLAFLVMELGKQDLESSLKERQPLSHKERKRIWRQLVEIALVLCNNSIVIELSLYCPLRWDFISIFFLFTGTS